MLTYVDFSGKILDMQIRNHTEEHAACGSLACDFCLEEIDPRTVRAPAPAPHSWELYDHRLNERQEAIARQDRQFSE